MYKYLNLHPEGKRVGDCVKRALAKGLNIPYKELALELNRYKKKTGAEVFNEPKNYRAYLEKEHNAIRMSFPAVAGQSRMNGERFSQAYPKGTYILEMAKHTSVCVDGIIYDTWNCSEKCVYIAYKIK